jgi:hypothetical protein
MPASGKSVQVPSWVVYDLQHDKIAALRAHIPMDLFANNSSELYPVLVGPPVTRPMPQWLGRHPAERRTRRSSWPEASSWPSPSW